MNKTLEIDGLTAEQIYTNLQKVGVSPSDAAVMVSGWIFETLGKAKRTFDYREPFTDVNAACAAAFNRTFNHQDWVDGESVVQAQQSGGEDGFNVRFHRIETDLDAIRADLMKSFQCLADMRASLRRLLDEIRAEINRLNNDVYTCCNKSEAASSATIGSMLKNPKFLGVTKLADKNVSLWDTPEGTFILPVIQTFNVDPVGDDRVRLTAELSRYLSENAAIAKSFPNGFTKAEFVKQFGKERTRDGHLVEELVDIVPEGTRYEVVPQLLEDIADRQAATLRTTDAANVAILSTFGLESGVKSVADASVDTFKGIPPDARVALSKSNIETLGKLAAASPQEAAKVLRKAGLKGYTAGDVAEWTAAAKVLTKVR